MKRILFLILAVFFFIGLVSAEKWTYEEDYSYGDASAYVKVVGMSPECDGQRYGNYCVGNYYVDVSYIGDEFYMGYSYISWSPVSDESGYTGIPSAYPGRKFLPIKDGHPQGYIICAWDFDEAYNGDWAWTSMCGGHLVDVFSWLTIVECYQDSDCGSNQYCKKIGSTDQEWSCETKFCDNGEERCFGNNLQKCEDYDWEDKGAVLNKCGVTCLSDANCPVDSVSDKFCNWNDIVETRTDNSCFNYQCISSIEDVVVETCSFKCEEISQDGAICIEKICEIGELMCSDEENAIICQNNKWELSEECGYGCEDGRCRSFYTTSTFYKIIAGVVIGLFVVIITFIIILKRKK